MARRKKTVEHVKAKQEIEIFNLNFKEQTIDCKLCLL